jgi:secondary thiamine-phosphate synthase enzyme
MARSNEPAACEVRVASAARRPVIEGPMSKTSTATVRRKPVGDVSAATPAGFVIHGESIPVATTAHIQLVDVTDRIMDLVRGLNVCEGMVSIWSMHTTCGVLINESQPALHEDMTRFLEDLVGKDRAWLHNDPARSDCSRRNADAHLRAMLVGHSLAIQVSGGEAVLGQWQRILVAELDGPRERQLRVQVWGMAPDAH